MGKGLAWLLKLTQPAARAFADMPYDSLFDRNERTICATYAKLGDLEYNSPSIRIGSYMEYAAKLKIDHLVNII